MINSYVAFVKRKLKALKYYLAINWIKTLYLNFNLLPFNEAKQLPIIIFGRIKLSGIKGKIIINTPSKFGLVKLNFNQEIITRKLNRSELRIDGIFQINGGFNAGNDFILIVLPGAYLEIGEGSYLGTLTKLIVTNDVKIGKGFRFGYESQLSDSNYHYTINLEDKSVNRFNGQIIINDYCWVGNRTSITKDTITPKFLIVGSNSLLNKNYTKEIPESSFIAGIPAKLIKKNIVRVFDHKLESKINRFFLTNTNETIFFIEDDYC